MEYETKKSSGVAKAGLALGIIGTGLAGLMAANNNGFGLFSNGAVNQAIEDTQESYISRLESEVAELKSMRYTDSIGIDLYKNIIAVSKEDDAKLASMQNQIFNYVLDLDRKVSLNEQAQALNREFDIASRNYEMTILNNKIDYATEKNNLQTCFDRQINAMADASIVSYVQSNYVPGVMKLPITSISPQPTTSTTTSS